MSTVAAITPERELSLWRSLDETRGKGPPGFLPIIRHLRNKGEHLSLSELMYIQRHASDCGGPFVVPTSVAQFFGQLINSRASKLVLNPAGGLGLLGAWIAATTTIQRIDIVTTFAEAREVILPLDSRTLTVHVGSWSDTNAQLCDHYDAIVASGPVGLQSESRTYHTSGGRLDLKDDPSCLLIADVLEHLSASGFVAVVLAPSFKWNSRDRSVRKNLDRLGLSLSALLTLRPGVFPETSIAFDIAILERTKFDSLFVAEVPEDPNAQAQLVSRLWKRKNGSTPSLGRLVSESKFYGLPALEANERAKQIAMSRGLEAIPFNRAVIDVRSPKRKGLETFLPDERSDAVYLPEMALTAATTRQEELPERLKSYFQLIVNQEVVLPQYLADILNTSLGHAMREAVRTGLTIPRINESLLRESVLYLAPLPDQKCAIEAVSAIRSLRHELSELESRIWERPRQVSNVISALAKVNHEERFDEWLESLPFPLASILRAYNALDRTDKDRYERLLHFFEALSAFAATIHLSALRSDELVWNSLRPVVSQILQSQHMSLKRPTFGLWRVVLESLAKETRRLVHGTAEQQAHARALFRVADLVPIEVLTSKTLISVLQRANEHRNRWTGHGGAVGPAEASERHNQLRSLLDQIRGVFGTIFLHFELLEPREAEILPGPLYRCNVRRVMGSNPVFEHAIVELTTPAFTGGLYLHNPGHDQALGLIEVVSVKNAPQAACYFFNRDDSSGTHMVSYHFSERPEIVDGTRPLKKLVSELSEFNDAG